MRQIDYDITDDSFYLFTCAELKAREKEFLDAPRLERILKSGSVSEFLRILRDTVYSEYTGELDSSQDFEGVIAAEYKKIAVFLSARLRESHQAAAELLFFEENLHNLKTVIKSGILDADLERLFLPVYYSYKKLKNAAATGNYEGLSLPLSGALRFAAEIMAKEKDYQVLEFKIEKFYLKQIYGSVEKTGSRLIMDYLKHLIDILNIKNIYRREYFKEDLSFNYFLHDSGHIPVNSMKEYAREGLDVFQKKIGRTDYGDIAAAGAGALQSEGIFSVFEKAEDNFYINFFEPLNYTVSNIEKIFQFFLRKKMELKTLNMIFTGILHSVDIDRVKNRIGA